ncbi:BamA/TamA family outer membrane protein [Pararcticibacter amylolyticus]|uniref:Bacterial surface antigen (D15) domain-containing protein n=1 Tax=Pararcticibacter amylolyticus TaxID=2173175 RepID=A0A2U2PLR4_9SPHI|nr:BamA/TamA family outer membrane protein [Pararcticibacter amylolyticus]PWG82224.1 hypothetical protein DDR33_04220 [Pararcticibacter amylolyticus]
MKKLSIAVFLLIVSLKALAQDSVLYRVILIGDAGEMDPQQKNIITDAAKRALAGRSAAVYLGDNIYPSGIGLPGSKDEETTKAILKSQYLPLRNAGIPVFFIPGNHDWDRSGPLGLEKVKRQWAFLNEQNDSLLRMLPPDGCPDPVAINFSENLTMIAFDSEWWLYTYPKENRDADCDCRTKEEVIARMKELLYQNRNKVILLASHHPFQSYGTHGGHFSLKDHLFPLTAVNKNLYLPLPLVGSFYPLLRNTFTNPEDLRHPLYQDMIKNVNRVSGDFPNIIHVAGHEHGLQLIRNNKLQVVSGSGAKRSFAAKGKHSLFAEATQGYVTADILTDRSIKLTYYILKDETVIPAFEYRKPYVPASAEESVLYKQFTGDSITVAAHESYDRVSKIHRKLFGENYRKEWAADTRLPLIRISEIKGGLTPVKRGGGMQSVSLRLRDKTGKEWVIRSVEKSPDLLLPPQLRETFARDWLDDAVSAQHPYSALVIPPIADAVGVPHSNPIIGVIAPDKSLGIYEQDFVNKVCLLEEREPAGDSDNSFKMLEKLKKDNDNSYDSETFLKARLIDLLTGDWDRHEDQWRWVDLKEGNEEYYQGVPRDRDQVFRVSDGIFPRLAKRRWIAPTLQGFNGKIDDVRYSLFKTRFVNALPASQLSYERWMKITEDFVAAVTDSVLETALKQLPASSYHLRHDELLGKLKERRANIPGAMAEYYRFINKIQDIRLSDKNEKVTITEDPGNWIQLSVNKVNKDGELAGTIMSKSYDPVITKEIRIYTGDGNDSTIINAGHSPVKFRIIGNKGTKKYNIIEAAKTVDIYGKDDLSTADFEGSKIRKHLSGDSLNTAFVPVNLYNVTMPLASVGINLDDGFLMGIGFRHTQQEGFRTVPFANSQSVLLTHSFSTKAFRIIYNGIWIHAVGKADFTLNATVNAPDNTMNFFGRGNETEFDKSGDFKKYYRTRFDTYTVEPALRWKNEKGTSLSVGPSLQYYSCDRSDNEGRFINNTSMINSYDSLTIGKRKLHGGLAVQLTADKRNNPVLPSWGSLINVRIQAYKGLNNYSESFIQVLPQVSFYKSLNRKSTIVLAERAGGGITAGKTTFYQSLFLGGQDNLLGFRQFRFAGQHLFYNNIEIRAKITDVMSYILPGQLGIMGLYDTGRVWEKGENSSVWHHGAGAGLYFAPAQMALFRFLATYSKEGWYPSVAMNYRF